MMRESARMANLPEDVPAVFAERFNSGDAAAVQEMYELDAAFVPESGIPVRGPADIRSANAGFLRLGLPITVRTRRIHTAGDIAMLVVDWEIDGPGPDGAHLHIKGTATDVARRGADGHWRYLIDSPFGGS